MSLEAKLEGKEAISASIEDTKDGSYRVTLGDEVLSVEVSPLGSGRNLLKIDGRVYRVGHRAWDLGFDIEHGGRSHRVDVGDPRRRALSGAGAASKGPLEIKSPMPGKVIRVLVEPGQAVEEGDGLVVVEAMKMENEYKATQAGIIEAVFVEAGQTLEAGAKMLRMAPPAEA